MEIITSLSDMQSFSRTLRKQGKAIGLVPTMGFLHEGHLSLMRDARQACDIVVCEDGAPIICPNGLATTCGAFMLTSSYLSATA